MADDRLSLVFGALADPTRRDILTRLARSAATVGDLAANYEISRPAISQHLAVLERAGLIERTVRAQWRECRFREEGLDEASEWIAEQKADWSERFDLLDEHLRRRREEER
jgi:DNA-binding transcriptional ArsR family regulator